MGSLILGEKENLVADFRAWGLNFKFFVMQLPGLCSCAVGEAIFIWIFLTPSHLRFWINRKTVMERPPNPTLGLTNDSFYTKVNLPLPPSVFVSPLVCAFCIWLTDLKLLVVYCEPHIIFSNY